MGEISEFLRCTSFAVAGASADRSKYGNIVFRALCDSGRDTLPIHPTADRIEGIRAYPSLEDAPRIPQALSIVTRPEVTRSILAQAAKLGVRCVWMQPGAEDAEASSIAREAGMLVIDDGSCILIALATERNQAGRILS
ncbi:MAG: CoA-binding protein [Planctomycetota bacterium]